MSTLPKKLAGAAATLALCVAAGGVRADALPLWTLEGAANRVHVLGSIHFLKPGRDRLPAGITDAYEQADVVIMELDLDDLDAAASQETMQRLGVDPRGRSLEALLGAADYRSAVARARAAGLDLEMMRGLEPWLAALMVSQLQLARLGYDASSGVEQQLLALAARDGKEIRGLETLEQQLAALDALPAGSQRDFLLQTLDDAATMADQVDAIVDAWKRGDTAALEKNFLEGLEDQPDLYRRLVVDRNRDWARQLERLLRDRRDYLVVVGTLHLVGPDSVIAMLDRAGHEARQAGAD